LKQHLFEIETYGFTLIEEVLSRDQVAEMRAVTERLLTTDGEDLLFKGRAGHVSNLPPLDPIYFSIIDHPRVLPVLEAVMGRDLILASLNARVVRSGDTAQTLHGDVPAPFLKPGPPVMMNTIWLLDDFSAENGATRIVPGSHRTLQQDPPEGVTVKFEHRVIAPAGCVLLFNG
jgi:ectoine hydroxylase-related dioxygenase (phytanoyl-CoA dioxygenase family)